jgi:hypothetical protein
MIKLLRMVRFRRWKIAFFSVFRWSCGPISPHTSYVYYSCTTAGCTAFTTEISLAGGKGMSVIMCTFHLSCHTRAVNIPNTPVFMSPYFNFIFCPKFLRINFLFGLTVPQQFTVLVCKSSTLEMR